MTTLRTTLRSLLLGALVATSVVSARIASADTNYVFYTVESVQFGGAAQKLAIPRTYPSTPDLASSAVASEAFNRLQSFRGGSYSGAALTLDANFASTGAATVMLGSPAPAEVAVMVSEIYWTMVAAGVREVRFADLSKEPLRLGDVPYGAAVVSLELWQVLAGAPRTGFVLVGDTVLPAAEVGRRLETKDKALLKNVTDMLVSPLPFVRLEVVNALPRLGLQSEDTMLPLLKDPDIAVRKAAITSFKGTKSKKALTALETVVQSDPEPTLQSAADKILSDAGNTKYQSVVLYEKLRDADDGVVMDAVQKLSATPRPDVALALVGVLTHKSEQVRSMALKTIIASKSDEALRRIVEDQNVQNSYRSEAATALSQSQGDDADHGLRYLVLNGSDAERIAAIGEVEKRRRFKVVPDLLGALDAGSATVRATAAKALGVIKDSKALGPLATAVGKFPAEKAVFEEAVVAVFQGLSVDEVTKSSESDNKILKALAIKALAGFIETGRANARVIDTLKARLADPDIEIRRSVAYALARVNDADVVGKLLALQKDPDAGIREQVAVASGRSSLSNANDLLLAMLDDSAPGVKRATADGLRERKVAAALQKLKFQWKNQSGEVRSAVMKAIVALAVEADWDGLFQIWQEALYDQEADVKVEALRGLSRRRDARLPGLFAPLARDTDNAVKIAALDALGTTGDPSAVEYITGALLEAQDKSVKLAALKGLESLKLEAAKKPIMEFVKNESDPDLKKRANEVFDSLP